jgi:hypothetical protein
MYKPVFISFSLLFITSTLFSFPYFTKENNTGTEIEWIDNLKGNFVFSQKQSYPEGITLNTYNQLVCDGFCDPETDKMRNKNGKILKKYLTRYYQLIDTTRYIHTIESEAQCYEWAGTDRIIINRISEDTLQCYTLCNTATHSSLELTIIKNRCIPRIKLQSITSPATLYFGYKKGSIKVDRQLWAKGIMKAEFHFYFEDTRNPETEMWWKGKIYSKIKNDELPNQSVSLSLLQ